MSEVELMAGALVALQDEVARWRRRWAQERLTSHTMYCWVATKLSLDCCMPECREAAAILDEPGEGA